MPIGVAFASCRSVTYSQAKTAKYFLVKAKAHEHTEIKFSRQSALGMADGMA